MAKIPYGVHEPTQTCSSTIGNSNTPCYEYVRMKQAEEVRPSELVRDLVFILQGLDGRFVRFSQDGPISERRPASISISCSNLMMLLELAKIGEDFRQIRSSLFTANPQVGSIRQSFISAINDELRSYLRTVAALEASITAEKDGAGFSLRKAFIWLQPANQQMRLLRALAIGASDLRGSALISFVHKFVQHGSEGVSNLFERICRHLSIPLIEIIEGWLQEGTILDHFNEFFIKQAKLSDDAKLPLSHVWTRQFIFENDEVPTTINMSVAEKVYFILTKFYFHSFSLLEKLVIFPNCVEVDLKCRQMTILNMKLS